jgi:hypothetical protein
MPEPPTVNLSLRKLLEKIDEGALVLPEIQRDFVWTRKSVMLLFDSLFRGLPIGHMLVWKARKPVQHKHFQRNRQSRVTFDNFYGYLLDGQQRLTALARVRDADEDYRLMFYAWPDRDRDGAGTFEWLRDWNKKDAWYVPVAEVLQGRFDRLGYLRKIKKDEDYEPGLEARIDGDLIKIEQLLEYNIGVIEFETDEYREATELFIRFNSTGRKLSKSDLFLAELAVRVPGLATTDIQRVAHEWPGFEFTMPFLTQCLLAVFTGRLRTKAKQAWGDPEKSHASDIKKAWRRTERGLGNVIKFLTGVVKWQSADLIPSFNALVPLVVIAAENDGISRHDAEMARRWLLLAGVRTYFSGSVHTEIDKLLRRLRDGMSIKQLWRATSRRLRKLQPRDFEASRISGPVTSLYLSMLADSDARDWGDPHLRLDGKVQGHNAELQVHHFFPQALLRKHSYGQDIINTFGNYTVLSANTNLNVGAEEPATYMRRIKVTETQLAKQCLPADRTLWRVDRYVDFLKKRRQLLAERANQFLGF